ncbi:hypothetical protein D3C74_322500 [compost metagenome]
MIFLSQFGAISAIRIAIPTEIGTAMIMVNAVKDNVLMINNAAPNRSSSGVQLKEKKNSANETSPKVRIAVLPIKKTTIASTRHKAKMLNRK